MQKLKKEISMTKSVLLTFLVSLFLIVSAQAATITVNSTADTQANNGACTLREAIINANADNQSGSTDCTAGAGTDAIVFSSLFDTTQTITLGDTSSALLITSNLTITGKGANLTTVRRNSATTQPFRIFQINAANVNISGLTVTGANVTNNNGGAILAEAASVLTLTAMVVTQNYAQSGGGILIINSSTLNLVNSTVSNNTTLRSGGSLGGGLTNDLSTVNIAGSTFNNNDAGFGGGIWNNGTMRITNSTISTNTANNGGGISNGANFFAGTAVLTLDSVTINNNTASSSGGGLVNYANNTTTMNNTIIANSVTGGDCATPGGTVNATYSLIEDASPCVNGTNTNNRTGDPNLGPLANNGGSTQTHALLLGSIAIDTGNTTLIQDQRGTMRPVDQPSSPNGTGNLADIGAYEIGVLTAAPASISGRILNSVGGRGVSNAVIYITDQSGNIKTTRSNPFGYFIVDDIETGQFLIINVYHKNYQFDPQVVMFNSGLTDLTITPQSSSWMKMVIKK